MNKKLIFVTLTAMPSICVAESYDQRLNNLESNVNYLNSSLSNNVNMLIDSIQGSYRQLDLLKADGSTTDFLNDQVADLKEYKLEKYTFEKEHNDRLDVEDDLYEIKADKTDLDNVKGEVKTTNNNISSISSKIDNVYSISYSNQQDIELLNKEINSSKNDKRILESANNYTDIHINNLNNKVDKLKKETRSGISSAIAMANIPTTPNIGKLNIGIGLGNFKDSSSLAIGSSYRFNESITSKFSIANSNNVTSFGAGMNYDF